MTDRPQARPPLFSRRRLLRGAIGLAGAATSLAASAGLTPAQAKVSQKSVGYQPEPKGDKRCDKCVQFQPPAACKLVDGVISPQGWCRVFAARPQ